MKVCIVGIGKLGYAIALALLNGGNDVTILDINTERIQNAGNSLDTLTVQGDALKVETLKQIDIASHDLIIAATEEDEKNIVICSFAKKLGCPKAMARVRAPQHIRQLDVIKDTFGIEQLLNPDFACASEMYKYLTERYAFEGGMLTQDGISIHEFESGKLPELTGKKISECGSILGGLLIAAISRNGKIIIPNGNSLIEAGDIIYVLGLEQDVIKFAGSFEESKIRVIPHRVMIAGGGKTGFFLAQMLEERGIATKIIEQDIDRCKELAAELNDTIIINGDASELSILRDEGLESMDAFIAATGFDEENLLLALLVKQFGVEDVVAKVSRDTFIPITKDLGASAIINPQQIIANNVLSYVRRNGVVIFSRLINGQAEFREVQAEGSMPLTKKTLSDMNIPEGIIILAVKRGKNVIIPNGKTQIASGDKVILLSLLSAAGSLESLLTKSQSSIL